MLKKIEYSDYQLDIFNEVSNGTSNLIINAVAGSGKTTTIEMACRKLQASPKDVCFLAFNKLIAEELKTRLNGYAYVSTLHAFGFNVLKKL